MTVVKPVVPKEIQELEKIYEPYLVGCHLPENAPLAAVEALKKVREWAAKQDQ